MRPKPGARPWPLNSTVEMKVNKEIISRYSDLTEVEIRNVESVYRWAREYQKPGGSAERLVDEVYCDSPEVVSVLTNLHVAHNHGSKTAWREAELELGARVAARRVVFDAIHPSDNVVCVEARIEQELADGSCRGWPFAVFLYFDDEHRILRDHTYMLPPPDYSRLEQAAAEKDAESRNS